MGAWGCAPWDDDSAADWFADLFEQTKLDKKIEETLQLDPEEYHAEIRAASSLLVMLGRTYVWPIDKIDSHLELAISSLEKIRDVYDEESDFLDSINQEIAILNSRKKNAVDSPNLPQPSSWGKFWS